MKKYLLLISAVFCSAVTFSQEYFHPTALTDVTVYDLANLNEYIFAATERGIYRSSDSGYNWQQVNNGLTDTLSYNLASDKKNNLLFTGGWSGSGGLFRSTDYGATWLQTGISSSVVEIEINLMGDIFVVNGHLDTLFRSTNNGQSWTPLLDAYPIWSLYIDSLGTVYLGSDDLINYSTDNGDSWEWTVLINPFPVLVISIHSIESENLILAGGYAYGTFGHDGIMRAYFISGQWQWLSYFATDIYGSIIAGTNDLLFAGGSGVIRSTNYGVNWVQISNLSVNCFLIDQNDYLFAGGIGVYRSVNPITLVETDSNNFLDDYRLSQNYPNPFNPSTTIKFQMPELSFVILKVYDVLGNEIATLVNEEKPAGSYEVVFNSRGLIHQSAGGGLPSGIYFYQLRAGDYVETKKMMLIK